MNILDKIKRVCLENVVKDEVEDFKRLFVRCVDEIQHKFNVDEGGLKLDCLGGDIRLDFVLKLEDFIFLKVKTDRDGNITYSIMSTTSGCVTFRYMLKLQSLWFFECDISKVELQNINNQLKNMIDELRGSV